MMTVTSPCIALQAVTTQVYKLKTVEKAVTLSEVAERSR